MSMTVSTPNFVLTILRFQIETVLVERLSLTGVSDFFNSLVDSDCGALETKVRLSQLRNDAPGNASHSQPFPIPRTQQLIQSTDDLSSQVDFRNENVDGASKMYGPSLEERIRSANDNFVSFLERHKDIDKEFEFLKQNPSDFTLTTIDSNQATKNDPLMTQCSKDRYHQDSNLKPLSTPDIKPFINEVDELEESIFRRKRLKRITESESKAGFCPICYTDTNGQADFIAFTSLKNCNHSFCLPCITEWSNVCSRCPLCKREIEMMTYTSQEGKLVNVKVANKQPEFSEEENSNDRIVANAESECYFCKEEGDPNKLLICDHCHLKCCHLYCLDPPLEFIPQDEWYCDHCVRRQLVTPTNPVANIFNRRRRPRPLLEIQHQNSNPRNRSQRLSIRDMIDGRDDSSKEDEEIPTRNKKQGVSRKRRGQQESEDSEEPENDNRRQGNIWSVNFINPLSVRNRSNRNDPQKKEGSRPSRFSNSNLVPPNVTRRRSQGSLDKEKGLATRKRGKVEETEESEEIEDVIRKQIRAHSKNRKHNKTDVALKSGKSRTGTGSVTDLHRAETRNRNPTSQSTRRQPKPRSETSDDSFVIDDDKVDSGPSSRKRVIKENTSDSDTSYKPRRSKRDSSADRRQFDNIIEFLRRRKKPSVAPSETKQLTQQSNTRRSKSKSRRESRAGIKRQAEKYGGRA